MYKFDLLSTPHPFFHGLCDRHLRCLAEGAHRTHFPKGSYIFREGELANRFYLLRAGSVVLESAAAEGAVVLLQTLGPGDVLGWSWLLPPFTWHFDARAVEETDAIFLPGVRLREECKADKALGYELLKRMTDVVVHRQQATRQKLVSDCASSLAMDRLIAEETPK